MNLSSGIGGKARALGLARRHEAPQMIVERVAVDDALEHRLPLRRAFPGAKLTPRRLRLLSPVDLGPRAASGKDVLERGHVPLDLPEPVAAGLRRALRGRPEERLVCPLRQ